MALTHRLDHAAKALERLMEQLKPVPGLTKMLNAFNVQIQALEDAFWQLYTERWLSVAEGVQLDAIGKILAEPRDGSDDEPYRERLRAKIRVLRSSGTAPNILTIFRLMLPDNDIRFLAIGGAGFILDIGEIDVTRLPTYERFIRLAKSAGINAQLSYHDGEDGGDFSDAFTFSVTDDTTAGDTAKGFGDGVTVGLGGRLVGTAT